MALDMFIKEVAVEELSIGKVANMLVIPLLTVDQLVANNCIQAGQLAPC